MNADCGIEIKVVTLFILQPAIRNPQLYNVC